MNQRKQRVYSISEMTDDDLSAHYVMQIRQSIQMALSTERVSPAKIREITDELCKRYERLD